MERKRFTADVVVTCDGDGTVYSPGAVEVGEGRIQWVGQASDISETDGLETTQNLGGLLMPGLVNTHCHTPMTLVRGCGDGLPLARWLSEAMWPREGLMTPEDAWWGMTLGSAEMLLRGITTSCEMYLHEDAIVDAVKASGGRLVMTPAVLSALHSSGSQRIDELIEFFATHHAPESRVTVGVAPHSAYDLGIDQVAELADLARSLDTFTHIHLAETLEESRELEARHGGSITRILHDRGVFTGRVLAAHCVWVDKSDIEILKSDEVAVAHCPISNMKLGSGIAPLVRLRELGVKVGYGTDGPASNNSLDLWEEVKIGPLLARANSRDSIAVPAGETLAMATRIGASAVGLDNVGCLAPGNELDMIRIDLDESTFVPITGSDELLAHLAWSGSSRTVTDVWVAGTQVVANGELLTVDMERAIAEVRSRALRLAAL